jgi:hypothetical protein
MRKFNFYLSIITVLSLTQPAAHADWDDVPAKADSDKQNVNAVPEPTTRIMTDREWWQMPHTPQELAQHGVLMQQMRARQAAAQSMNKQTLQFKPGTVLPGQSYYKGDGAFSSNPDDRSFFNGLTPEQAAAALSRRPDKQFKLESPDWAKQKIETRHYVDGVEHPGREDPNGFF